MNECRDHDAMLSVVCSDIFECGCIELFAYSKLFSLLQGWDLQSSKAPNSMKIVLFADFASSNPGLNQAQFVLKQLCNEGHQITLFGRCTPLRF